MPYFTPQLPQASAFVQVVFVVVMSVIFGRAPPDPAPGPVNFICPRPGRPFHVGNATVATLTDKRVCRPLSKKIAAHCKWPALRVKIKR